MGRWRAGRVDGTQGEWGSAWGGVRSGRHERMYHVGGQLADGAWRRLWHIDVGERGSWGQVGDVVVG